MMMSDYDLVILGSGSTAFAAAIRAADLGFTAMMTEDRTLGGTCVNRGCLPSKNLIAAAQAWHDAGRPRYPGLPITRGALDFGGLIRQKDEVVQAMRAKKYASVLNDRITVLEGHAELVDAETVRVNGRDVEGRHVLIATGARPHIPALRGLDSVPYLTSDLLTVGEGLELEELPASMAILGGGYIACELGQMFARFGTKVTIFERSDRLLSAFEPEIGYALRDVFEREGIDVRTESLVVEVGPRGSGVAAVTSTGDEVIADRLLVTTGRQPNTEGIGLEQAGVEIDERGFVVVDDELRTSVPGVWAAGDVRGGQMATPVGAHDGAIAADNALTGRHKKPDYTAIPRAVFTDPPVATVGLSDAEVTERGIGCTCEVVPMDLVPRAAATYRTEGLIKMIAERDTGKVVGVHMLGLDAHEVIHEAAMAMRFGATVDDIIDQVHIYPTMAEGLKIAALAFRKDVTKLSCCAE